jgi:hypothetical protein
MIDWLWHIVIKRNFISYMILVFALCMIAFGLSKSVVDFNLTRMCIVAIVGLTFGWICSVSSLRDWHVGLLGFIIGIVGSIFYYSQLSGPISTLYNTFRSATTGFVNGSTGGSPDTSPIFYAIQQLGSHLGIFLNRIWQWVEKLPAGQVGQDKLVIGMAWGLLIWFVAVWAGRVHFRYHSALISILPAISLLAGALNYVAANPLYLAPLIGTTLILRAVTTYDQQEQYWIEHHIDYAEDIRFDLNLIIIGLSLGLMFISVFAPSFSIQRIISASQQVTHRYQGGIDSIAKSLGLIPQPQAVNTLASLHNPGLPRSHLLGSGSELSKDLIMVVRTGDYPPAKSIDSLSAEPPHYYWRSLTYDIYTGHGWDTSSIDVTDYSSNQPAIEGFLPITGTLRLVHQSIQFTKDLGGLIYSAGQLISVDEDYQVAWRLLPAGNSGSKQNQIADEFAATSEGDEYSVESFINTVGLNQMRSASGVTPSWIKTRYLALPESLPGRVRQLAIDLTQNQLTEYDKAAALETYLRTFTYTLDLPSPPSDRDVVDYFLFDLKRGYCDYYASAMVVMARSIGLPARLVTGYSSGIYDPINAYYIVTEGNAHSWAEIYLPGSGWVEFEPTASMPTIQRSADQIGIIEIPQLKPVQHFSLVKWFGSIHQKWWALLSGMIGALFLGLILMVIYDQWHLHRLSPSMAIVQLYKSFFWLSQPLLEDYHIDDTPFEYATRLSEQLKKYEKPHRLSFYFQRGVEETAYLTRLFTQVVYSPHTPEVEDQKTAIHSWIHLRMRLWIASKFGGLIRQSSNEKPDHK